MSTPVASVETHEKEGKEEYVVCVSLLFFMIQMAVHAIEIVDAVIRMKS